MATPRKTRSQGPAEPINLDHPHGENNNLDVEDLDRELAFYASYHSNNVNKIIHFIFIPQIWWSWLVIAGHLAVPGFDTFDIATGLSIQPSLALGFALAYQFYYIILDTFSGLTILPVLIFQYLTSAWLVAHPPSWLPFATRWTDQPSSLPIATVIFLNAWIWQFYGHFAFEGRAPALTESVTQALVTAPFFVHIEFLFSVFDWNPALHKRIKNLAGLRIRDMNRARREKGE